MVRLHALEPVLSAAEADALAAALELAEHHILATIDRECEALRTGRLLAAQALHARLNDCARLYLSAARATRASLAAVRLEQPEFVRKLEDQRQVFASLLRIELSVLATERAAALPDPAEETIATPAATGGVATQRSNSRESHSPRYRGGVTGPARKKPETTDHKLRCS